MRSYGQFCSVARALDVVGDRWTLLIVRELLLGGACRYDLEITGGERVLDRALRRLPADPATAA